MADCLRALFTPQPSPDAETNLKEVQRAFSILVNIPKVKEDFTLYVSNYNTTQHACMHADATYTYTVTMSNMIHAYDDDSVII